MKTRLIFPKIILFLLLFTSIGQAQVGIGTTSPAEGSILDISSTDKGILIPRVDITDLSTAAPVTEDLTNSESLLVYNTNTTTGKGFYYWDSTQWVAVGGSAENIYTTDGSLPETRTVNLDENILRFDNGVGRYLNLQGASISDNSDPFLFTTFNALRFDIDNAPVLSLNSDQNVGIGLADANAKLHIFENNGTAASASAGTIVIEHGNEGGASSIVFKSRSNNNSDYGYLNFSDDGSGNGSTNENALLEIGIQNDAPGAYQDDINIASSGNVGISNTAPQEKLHISGNNSTIRIDGLSSTNNTENVPEDVMPVYVDDNGTIVLQPSLVQTYMPINAVDYIGNYVQIRSPSENDGSRVTQNIATATVELSQESLVEIIYHISVSIADYDGGTANDGAPRLFRSYITDGTNRIGYSSGTYAQAGTTGNATVAGGYYYLSASGYFQLPAGNHTITLVGEGYAGEYGYRLRFGESNQERFQTIVHR